MSAAVINSSETLAHELHDLLKRVDAARFRADLQDRLRPRLEEARERLGRLIATVRADGPFAPLLEPLSQAADALDVAVHEPARPRRAWLDLRARLIAAYDALQQLLLAWDIHVPALRPTNYSRNVLHVGMGIAAMTVLTLFPTQEQLMMGILPWIAFATTAEFTRRRFPAVNDLMMRAFGRVAHPHEVHRVNSATWYAFALFGLVLADVPAASMVALAVLALGDPMAAILGRRYGRHELLHGRTVEGSLAFIAFGGAFAMLALALVYPQLGAGTIVATSLGGALFGSVAEAVSRRIDDNLSVPWAAALGAWLVFALLGVPPR